MEYIEDYYRDNDLYDDYNSCDDRSIKNKEKMLMQMKNDDRGYCKFSRLIRVNKKKIYKKINYEVYSSGDPGSNIRDAETGEYYPYKVGSYDEDLFYSVILATGECNSKNGSSILFYKSPQHYMKHQKVELSLDKIRLWEMKNYKQQEKNNNNKKKTFTKSIIVN